MSNWECVVTQIEKIEKHPDADTLSIYWVLGNPIIAKTGRQVNDLVIYYSIDTIFPDIERYYYLCPPKIEIYVDENGERKSRSVGKKYELGSVPESARILCARKIRGVYSEGLIEDLPENFPLTLGDSVVEYFGLTKWEEPEDDEPNHNKKRIGLAAKAPPVKAPKYDLEPAKKYYRVFEENEPIVFTEKLHGESYKAVYVSKDEQLHVSSRNIFKKKDQGCKWWDVAERYNLESVLKAYPDYVFYGEIYGQHKGFPYGTKQIELAIFDIYDSINQTYLDYDEQVKILAELNLPKVPVLLETNWDSSKWEEYKLMAEGTTTLDKHIREGFVVRPVKNRVTHFGRVVLKHVGQAYNLSKGKKK
jgi:RNA ligase (TIGR02306 family)